MAMFWVNRKYANFLAAPVSQRAGSNMKGNHMPPMESVIRRSHARTSGEMEDYAKAHKKIFGSCADVRKVLRSLDDVNLVAVVGQVHDLDELRRISRTPAGDAMMRRNGFLEQFNHFVEEA